MSGADLNAKNKNDETPSGEPERPIEFKHRSRSRPHLICARYSCVCVCVSYNISDICEDAEIRERIEQLKSEQESKRLAEAQRRRVRRSQSNNTRYAIKAIKIRSNPFALHPRLPS